MEDSNSAPFASVLILEDEALVSLLIEDAVRDMGASAVHAFNSVEQAREIATRGAIDCAILDVRLQGGTSHEIADILSQRGIPFVFSTGSGIDTIPPQHQHRPLVSKPFGDEDLKAGVIAALSATERADR